MSMHQYRIAAGGTAQHSDGRRNVAGRLISIPRAHPYAEEVSSLAIGQTHVLLPLRRLGNVERTLFLRKDMQVTGVDCQVAVVPCDSAAVIVNEWPAEKVRVVKWCQHITTGRDPTSEINPISLPTFPLDRKRARRNGCHFFNSGHFVHGRRVSYCIALS